LLREFKAGRGGIAGPSANKFGQVSPTTAQHVRDEFVDTPLLDFVLDGGQCDVGIESTILDVSRVETHGVVLLRPGQISVDQIAAVIGQQPRSPDVTAPRASGTLDAHYAPRTPVVQLSSDVVLSQINALHTAGYKVAVITRTVQVSDVHAQYVMADDASAYAHDLYAALRDMDHTGADLIVVESLPENAQWQGVNDRLRRAAFDSTGILHKLLNA
jgi:L-threonylcarbamoyladenylate synthase